MFDVATTRYDGEFAMKKLPWVVPFAVAILLVVGLGFEGLFAVVFGWIPFLGRVGPQQWVGKHNSSGDNRNDSVRSAPSRAFGGRARRVGPVEWR